MVDEPAVTLCRVPFAVAKIGTVMTARSYVQGDHVRSLAELMSKCGLIDCVMTLVCIRFALGAARMALFQSCGGSSMKALTLALVTSAGIGVFAVSTSSAAPVNGADIGTAASADQLKQNVQYWRWRDHWHHWGWHHGWCYYHPYRCGRY
jgi:hypothetical protein